MSLYTNVYWTKRILAVLGIILVICSGISLFNFLQQRFTREIVDISNIKPEQNFQDFSLVSFQPITNKKLFSELNDATEKGNLSVNQDYPGKVPQLGLTPFVNVYQIEQKQLTLSVTEFPKKVSEKFGFDPSDFTQLTTQTLLWTTNSTELEINGLYNLISYKNKRLYTKSFSDLNEGEFVEDYSELIFSESGIESSSAGQNMFSKVVQELDLEFTANEYIYKIAKIDYSPKEKKFMRVAKDEKADFIRIDAFRKYENILKTSLTNQTLATYPGFYDSNNYLILPIKETESNRLENIVEFGFYNWPVGKDLNDVNQVQTYYLKSVFDAYKELNEKGESLVSVTDWDKDSDIPLSEIEEIEPSRLDIFEINLYFYEDKLNRRYVQPVYVFEGQLTSSSKRYRLVYYVSAINYNN